MSRAGCEVDVTGNGADSVRLCEHITLLYMEAVAGWRYEDNEPDSIMPIVCHECGVEHLVRYFKE